MVRQDKQRRNEDQEGEGALFDVLKTAGIAIAPLVADLLKGPASSGSKFLAKKLDKLLGNGMPGGAAKLSHGGAAKLSHGGAAKLSHGGASKKKAAATSFGAQYDIITSKRGTVVGKGILPLQPIPVKARAKKSLPKNG